MEKYTSGPWHPINYAGYIRLQDGPYYEDNDVMNEEVCEEAEVNAKLAAASPEMFEALTKYVSLSDRQEKAFEVLQDSEGETDNLVKAEEWEECLKEAKAALKKATS